MARWLLCLGLVAAISGCTRDATQLVTVVATDLPPADIRAVRVRVWPIDDANPTVEGREPTGENRFEVGPMTDGVRVSLPFSFGVLPPQSGDDPRVEIQVDALDETSAVTVTRTARVGFVNEQSLRLPVFLSALCRGVVCPDTQTCIEGVCASSEVDETSLEKADPGTELVDAGAPPDTGPAPDAGGMRTIPDSVAPTFAIGTGVTESFAGGQIAFLGDTGDLFISGKGNTPATAELAAGVTGRGLFVARYGADGTQRWVRRWMMPGSATDLDLQGHSVTAAVLSEDVIYVCGTVTDVSLTEMDGATPLETWVSSGRLNGDDSWIAQLDANTGVIQVMSILSVDPAVTEHDVWCRGLNKTSAGLVVTMQVANFGTMDPPSFTINGNAIPSSGPTGPAEGAVLLLQPEPGGFTAISARHFRGAVGSTVAGPGETTWVSLEGSSMDLGGLLATEPTPPADSAQSVLLASFDASGVPTTVQALAHTSEQFSRALVASGGDRMYALTVVEERTADGSAWVELDARPRVGTIDVSAGSRSSLAFFELDAATGTVISVMDDVPVTAGPILRTAADGAGNLYVAGTYNSGSALPPLGTTPRPVDGAADAFVIRYERGTITPRWELYLSDRTSEMTWRDAVDGMAVSPGGRIALVGSTSASGIDLGLSAMPAGIWFALLE